MHRNTSRSARIGAALAGGLFALAACGGDDPAPATDDDTSTGAGGGSTDATAAAGGETGGGEAAGGDGPGACTLLTAAEVLDATGFQVGEGVETPAAIGSICEFDPTDPLSGQSITIQVTPGKADTDWEFLAESLTEDGGVEVDAGDEAVFKYDDSFAPVVIAQVAMRVGDDLVTITIGGMADTFSEDQAQTAAVDLAGAVVDGYGD